MDGLNGRRERPVPCLGDPPYYLGYEALSLSPRQLNGDVERLVVGLVQINPGVGRLMLFRSMAHARGRCLVIYGLLSRLPRLAQRRLNESIPLDSRELARLQDEALSIAT